MARVQAIEADQTGRLPGAYRLFLELIGGGAGLFMAGSVVYYPGILGLRESVHELLGSAMRRSPQTPSSAASEIYAGAEDGTDARGVSTERGGHGTIQG